MKASVLLLTLVLLAVPFSFRPSAEAQDGSTGAMLSSFVSTALSIGSGFLSSIAALLSLLVTAPCAIPATCVSFCIIFPLNILSSVMAGMTSIVMGMLASCPMAELTSLVDIGRAVPTACVAPLNLVVALVWIAVQAVLDAVLCVGYAYQFCIYAPCSLLINIVLGGIYAVCGLCPVISVPFGALFSLWQALNAITSVAALACVFIPDVCLGMTGAITTAISNIYMPEGTKAMAASVMPALFHTATIALWDAMTYAIIVGAANLGLATWCGGVTGIGACLYGLISNFIHAMFGLVSFATFLFGSIISLAVSCLALPAILLSIQKNCCGV